MTEKRTVESGRNRPITKTKGCDGCGKPISPEQSIVVIEKQVNRFRGDDEVNIYHLGCEGKNAD